MAWKYQSIPLELPAEFVEASSGFSLDIGCSTAKLVYRSKDDYENGKPIKDELKSGHGRVYITPCIAGTDLDDVIELIRSKCDLIRSGSEPTEVMTTGVGCNFFKDKLENDLNIKVNNQHEIECFIQSFSYLRKVKPTSELFYPANEKGEKLGKEEAAKTEQMLKQFSEVSFSSTEVAAMDPGEDDVVFPCVLAICGSAAGFAQVEADGKTWKMLDLTTFGGRAFLGLSALLTGHKDFATILANIERGSGRTVNEYKSDLVQVGSVKDTYSRMVDDEPNAERPLLYFGKAVTQERDSIKNEDILRSLFELLCKQVIQLGLYQCCLTKTYRLYFCGNLINNEYARYYMTQEFYMKQVMFKPEKEVKLRFIQNGGHLGSLGAFLKAKDIKENPL